MSQALVGIGLPTHNGEPFIAQALESLLAQDHRDLEIVVSDNASTDRTPDIVRDFMRRDSRVRHERVEALVSAPQNFNRAFSLTSGRYFMWAADDDLWAPSYVRRCVAALAADPTPVMACSSLRFIDPMGHILDAEYDRLDNPDLSSRSTVDRVLILLRRGGWYQVYGLARRDALQRTHLFQDLYGPDAVLVLELAMLGPFARIPEPLFFYRQFPERTEAARVSRQGGIRDPEKVVTARTTYLQEAMSETVRRSALGAPLKLRLRVEIIRAAYLSDTRMRTRTRREAATRVAAAVQDRDIRGLAKYTLALAVNRIDGLPRSGRRWAGRARRLAAKARRRVC
jgi:glycosyltransferase involved in cell wall biosynthesis